MISRQVYPRRERNLARARIAGRHHERAQYVPMVKAHTQNMFPPRLLDHQEARVGGTSLAGRAKGQVTTPYTLRKREAPAALHH